MKKTFFYVSLFALAVGTCACGNQASSESTDESSVDEVLNELTETVESDASDLYEEVSSKVEDAYNGLDDETKKNLKSAEEATKTYGKMVKALATDDEKAALEAAEDALKNFDY